MLLQITNLFCKPSHTLGIINGAKGRKIGKRIDLLELLLSSLGMVLMRLRSNPRYYLSDLIRVYIGRRRGYAERCHWIFPAEFPY
jgi:hypothetical protein